MTWWDSLSLRQQILVWIVGTALGTGIAVAIGNGIIGWLNKLTVSFEKGEYGYDRFKPKTKQLVIISLSFSAAAFLSIVGFPSVLTGAITISVVGIMAIGVAPFLRDSSIIDSVKVYKRTYHWKEDDWIICGDRQGHWFGSTMEDAFLMDRDGAMHQIPLRTFLTTAVTNRNLRIPGRNDFGLMRIDIPFWFPSNGPMEEAGKTLLKLAWKCPQVVDPQKMGVHTLYQFYEDRVGIVMRFWVKDEPSRVEAETFMYREGMKALANNHIRLASSQRINMIQTPEKMERAGDGIHNLSDPQFETLKSIAGLEEKVKTEPTPPAAVVDDTVLMTQDVSDEPVMDMLGPGERVSDDGHFVVDEKGNNLREYKGPAVSG